MNSVDIDPCPFCGLNESSLKFRSHSDEPRVAFSVRVRCESCGARGPETTIMEEFTRAQRAAGHDQAIHEWNRRSHGS